MTEYETTSAERERDDVKEIFDARIKSESVVGPDVPGTGDTITYYTLVSRRNKMIKVGSDGSTKIINGDPDSLIEKAARDRVRMLGKTVKRT